MKPTLTVALAALLYFSAPAQALREIILPFNYLQCTFFECDVQDKIDSAWRCLETGEKARLVLYTEQERLSQSHPQLEAITGRRAKLVYAYLDARKKMPGNEIKSLIPFLENDTASAFGKNDRYSDVIHRPLPGLHSVLLNKTETGTKFYTHLDDDGLLRKGNDYMLDSRYKNDFYTTNGLRIIVMPSSFILESGGAHSCETIRLYVEEYLTYGDMLAADLVTHSNGKLLETGGMVYIEAWCGDKKLKLANGKTLKILFPADERKEGMQAFNGLKNENMSHWTVQKGGSVEFKKADTDEETDKLYSEALEEEVEEYRSEGDSEVWIGERYLDLTYQVADGYLLTTANLGWINCDRFYDVEQKTELMVHCDRKERICYRLVFRDIRSIMPAYEYDNKGNFMFENIPSGEPATLLAYYVSKDKKTAFLGYKEITVGAAKEEELQLAEMSPAALQNMLKEVFPE